jgi:hypothetical protein
MYLHPLRPTVLHTHNHLSQRSRARVCRWRNPARTPCSTTLHQPLLHHPTALAAVCVCTVRSRAPRPPEMAHSAALQATSKPGLSPDGTHFALFRDAAPGDVPFNFRSGSLSLMCKLPPAASIVPEEWRKLDTSSALFARTARPRSACTITRPRMSSV